MAETIAKLVIKKTSTPGAIPLSAFLDYGELALNYTDGKLFFKNNLGSIISIGEADDTDFAKKSEDNNFIGLNTFGEMTSFNAGLALNIVTLTDGSIAWNAELGNLANVTLAENSTLENLTNVSPGSYVLRVVQDSVGGRTLDFGSNYKTSNGTPFEIGLDPDAITIITILNAGGTDLYLVGQKDFLELGGVAPATEPPAMLGINGIGGGIGDWMDDTSYTRIPDINGFSAWRYVETPLRSGLISAAINGVYIIEVYERLDAFDPWVLTQEVFQANAASDPWDVTDWTQTGTYPLDAVALTVSIVPSPGVYSALITVADSDPGMVGQSVQFFAQPGTWTWYGTDPIPPSTTYRSLNPFQGLSTRPHLYLAPRDNNVGGDWVIGFTDGNNELFEFAYLPSIPGVPVGTYDTTGLPGASAWQLVVTNA
jgi:hypothetical protein